MDNSYYHLALLGPKSAGNSGKRMGKLLFICPMLALAMGLRHDNLSMDVYTHGFALRGSLVCGLYLSSVAKCFHFTLSRQAQTAKRKTPKYHGITWYCKKKPSERYIRLTKMRILCLITNQLPLGGMHCHNRIQERDRESSPCFLYKVSVTGFLACFILIQCTCVIESRTSPLQNLKNGADAKSGGGRSC